MIRIKFTPAQTDHVDRYASHVCALDITRGVSWAEAESVEVWEDIRSRLQEITEAEHLEEVGQLSFRDLVPNQYAFGARKRKQCVDGAIARITATLHALREPTKETPEPVEEAPPSQRELREVLKWFRAKNPQLSGIRTRKSKKWGWTLWSSNKSLPLGLVMDMVREHRALRS